MTSFSLARAAALLALGLVLEAAFLLHAATPAPAHGARPAAIAPRDAAPTPPAAAFARCADGSFSRRCG